MAITVTATQGGSTGNGFALRVRVLTGTAAVQNGATASQSGVGGHNASIVTTVTGSLVYGALSNGANSAFTAEPLCTLVDDIADATNAERYGTFRTTSATGTPGSTLVGASAPTGNGGGMAAAEILPNGTITEDASSPAVVSTTGAGPLATASFTPPAGSLLVAMIGSDGGASVTTFTVSGGGLTWTALKEAHASSQDYAGVWVAQVAAGSAFVPLGSGRRTAARTPALPPARRYRQTLPVPHQLNPPYQFSEIAQRRQAWPRGLPRRGHLTVVVPPQVNPPYPFAGIRQWRQPRGFWPRKGHQFTTVPSQQAAAPNPAITFQQPKHLRMMYLRRGRQVTPVPAQQPPPAGVLQRHARVMAAPRRGKVTAAHLTQGEAPPRQRAPYRPRGLPPRRHRAAEVVSAQAPAAAPAWVQGHRSPLRALALLRRRFGQLLPWPQATQPPFSIGALTASDAPGATLTAAAASGTLTAATASATLTAADSAAGTDEYGAVYGPDYGPQEGTLTATDTRTGGPG